MQRINARKLLELYDVIRIAVNAKTDTADKFRDALAKRAGIGERETAVTIATNQDLAAFLSGRLG